ncbi:hypothetical protein KFE25_003894 [Diacronema lutheri]|uniref:Eukaryotic translation initiation factor 3 subunit I n=1 Tax=Diacronema lutheri TaxID=2081491 RepID=A0A8J5XDJ8_DIALT|nr:hypothetical protein KFE25_003894 [Diacronema lutheri]
MRPILVKGHERALTMIKYNKEGDLLFTVSKDHHPSVWYADNGEHIGTYHGHTGAVWCVAVNESSTLLLTGSADNSARLWDVPTGNELMVFKHPAPVRAVDFALGDGHFLTALDNIMGNKPTISVYELTPNIRQSATGQSDSPTLKFIGHDGKINRALWGPLNKTIVTCSDDASVRVWDAATGEQIHKIHAHRDKVTDIQYAWDASFLVTASKDGSAKLIDMDSFEIVKSYECDRPLNSAHISPLRECPYVIVGGGQDAMSVTTTSSKMGKLDAVFFHLVFEDELGSVKGHFGPINTLAIAPHGRSFASGGEDGYVRIHHFDPSYFTAEEEAFNPAFLQPPAEK